MRLLAVKRLGTAQMSENYVRSIIGNREVVGFGFNGQPTYVDRVDFPLPALRWKENTSDVQVI